MKENETLIIEDRYGDVIDFTTSPTGNLFIEIIDTDNSDALMVEINDRLAEKIRDFMFYICDKSS